MERKNTVLLTVIAVATLLVAVVGATFAYFTATNTAEEVGGAGTGEVNTTKLGNTTFTFEGKSLTNSYLDYPGGLAVFGSKANFEKDSEDGNKYNLTFDLDISYINNTDTDLYWALYMTAGDALEADLDPKCKLIADVKDTETHYWYADTNVAEGNAGKSCTLNASQKEILSGTTMIAYGKFSSGQTALKSISGESVSQGKVSEGNETSPTICDGELCNPSGASNPLNGRTLDSEETKSKYYYLVVQYPNKDQEQQQGDGGLESPDIQVNLKVKEGTAKVTAEATSGSQTVSE